MKVGPTRFMPAGGTIKWSIYLETCETAMAAFDEDTGEALATITVCLGPHAPRAAEDEVWVKDWSENIGMFDAMVAAGVITDGRKSAACGFSFTKLGRLTPEAITVRDAAFASMDGLMHLRGQVYPKEQAVG